MGTAIWLALLIPLITAVILKLKFEHQTLWWEFLVPFGVSVVLILVAKLGFGVLQTRDTEWWGNYVTQAEYFEDWSEWVDRTCSRENCSGSGEDRTCTTEYYDCSYEDHHPPRLVLTDNSGVEHSLSVPYDDCEEEEKRLILGWEKFTRSGNCGSPKFDELSAAWDNSTFVDLRRNAHDDDGDKYVSKWNQADDTLEPVFTKHTYENRVQASDSVFNFQDVHEDDIATYRLVSYPEFGKIVGYNAPVILGANHPQKEEASKFLNLWNAKLGVGKEVRMLVILFDEQPYEAAFLQESLWKGGNKNEFIVTVGMGPNHTVQWGHVISWTEEDALKINVRNWIGDKKGEALDLVALADYTTAEVMQHFERKEFSDFDYLTVAPPMWAVLLTFLLTLLVNAGLSAWIVANEHHEGRSRWDEPFGRWHRRNKRRLRF
jgi:hypothetical protein